MTALHVLLVEDDVDDSVLILDRLRRDGLSFTCERVETAEATAAALAQRPPDVVLSDYSLPAFSGEAALELVRGVGSDVPFILVSGKVGEETAAALMLAGANDFVLKDRLVRLVPAMRRELKEAEERQQHRDADAALRASEERFRLLAEHAQDIVFRYRLVPGPVMEYISPAVAAVTGHQPADFYADQELLFSLVDPEDEGPLRASWRSDRPEPLIVRWPRADGSTVWTEQRAVSVRDSGGTVVAIEGILRDITDHTLDEQVRHQLEDKLRQVERMESLGQLAGGVAHDFNNLLGVIVGYVDLMEPTLAVDDARRADLAGIRNAAERGAGLIRQLMIFSHLDPSSVETVDLNAVVVDTEHLLRRTIGANVDFIVLLDPDLRPISVDRGKLEQVLVNLVVNARDAMPGGGHITIRTANTDAPPAGPADVTPPAGPHARLTVSDTGTGMEPDVVKHAFEPFFTTKGPGDGTGLGLATVYGAVTEAGGQIRLSSEPGEGTTFDIYFPIRDAAGSPPPAEPAPAEPVRPETILVVDDEAALREVISRILRGSGYLVLEAATGAEALERYGGDAADIDAVLSDFVMPGMSGDVLIEALRRTRPTLPALLMSAYNPERRPGRALPAASFLSKPFTAPTLLSRLKEILASEGVP